MSGDKKLNVFLREAAEDSRPWYQTLDEPTRQKVFAYMRKLGVDETKLRENARKYSTPHGSVALGGADFEYNLKAECIASYLRAIRTGKTPTEALNITRLERTSLVKSFNASTSDYHIQRATDAEETLIKSIHREFTKIAEPKPNATMAEYEKQFAPKKKKMVRGAEGTLEHRLTFSSGLAIGKDHPILLTNGKQEIAMIARIPLRTGYPTITRKVKSNVTGLVMLATYRVKGDTLERVGENTSAYALDRFNTLVKTATKKIPVSSSVETEVQANTPSDNDIPIIPKTEEAGKTKIEWRPIYGDSTSSTRRLQGNVPGFVLIVRKTYGKYNSFAIVETDETGRVTSAAIEEKKGFKTFAEAKKAGIAALSKHFAMKNPGATPKAPKPILKGDRTSLNIKVQTFNGVKMLPKQYKTFKAMAQSMDVPVIVAAHNGAIVQMNHEPDGAVDYAVIYPLGRFVPGHANADPRSGFLPSHADEYHQRSAGHDEHAKPVESHGAIKPGDVPGMILKKEDALTDWLNQKFDSQIQSPAVSGLQRAIYDAARRLYFYTDKHSIKPVFITDQFQIVGAKSAKEVFAAQKTNFSNPASQAARGLMWGVTFDPTAFVFTVYEYIPKEALEPLALLKELGLGYKPDEARLAHPLLMDLVNQEPLGRMTIAQAVEFAKHYVRRPRMDNKEFSFTPLQWKTIYSAVAHAQSQDASRPHINGMLLRPGRRNKDEIEAVATNGAILSMVHVAGNPLPHSIFLPIKAVKYINAAYRAKQVPRLIFRNEELHRKSDSLNFGGTLTVDVEGKRTPFIVSVLYPDYERAGNYAVDRNSSIKVSVNTKNLMNILKEFSFNKDEKRPRIVLSFHEAQKTLEITREYYNAQNDRLHVTKSVNIKVNDWYFAKEVAEIAVNPIYFMDVMKSMKSAQTSLFFEDKGTAIRVADYSDVRSDNHNHEHIIMALRF